MQQFYIQNKSAKRVPTVLGEYISDLLGNKGGRGRRNIPHITCWIMTKCINNQSHCLFFRRLKAAIPCRKCAGVAYCSTFCRDEAEDSHHKYECEFHDLLTGLGCSQVARLALRMITIKPFQFFLNLKPKLASLPGSDNTSEDESDYSSNSDLNSPESKEEVSSTHKLLKLKNLDSSSNSSLNDRSNRDSISSEENSGSSQT